MAFWLELEFARTKGTSGAAADNRRNSRGVRKEVRRQISPDLLQLLRSQNGGILENSDFKFQEKELRGRTNKRTPR